MQLHDKGKVILTCLFAYFEAGLLVNIAEWNFKHKIKVIFNKLMLQIGKDPILSTFICRFWFREAKIICTSEIF